MYGKTKIQFRIYLIYLEIYIPSLIVYINTDVLLNIRYIIFTKRLFIF